MSASLAAYECMTEDELRLWREPFTTVAGVVAKTPCVDCPAWFEREARSQGRCSRANARIVSEARRVQLAAAARAYRARRRKAAQSRRYRAKLRSQVEAVRRRRAA